MSEKKSNKKLKIIICILLVLTIAIVIIIFKMIEAYNANTENKRILIEYSYRNLAWSYTYYGTVICEDGSIYKFEFTDSSQEYGPYDNIEERSKNILEHVTINKGKMNKNDLKKLKEELKNIENDTTGETSGMFDIGQTTTEYYNYDTKEIITLESNGDYNEINNSQNIQDVLLILEEYDIKL